MKALCSVAILTLAFLVSGICQIKKDKRKKSPSVSHVIEKCSANSDSLYDRQKVLEQLAGILNDSATYFHNAIYLYKEKIDLARVENGRPIDFTVYDLMDESNSENPLEGCIEFEDNHIYHFSIMFTPYSFSHIVILEGGKLKTFKSINCKKGDDVNDVISYLNQKLKDDKNRDEIISRLKNYRHYGMYSAIDESHLKCEEVSDDKKGVSGN
jgi:hypothetical protein